MRKISFALLVFLSFSAVPTLSFSKDVMKMVYFNNYAPFSWEEEKQMHGILIDVLNEALQKRMGIHVSHEGYPWARAQMMVKDGSADAFATVPTPERETYTNISNEPVILAKITLFAKKESPKLKDFRKIKSISDLKGIKMGNYTGNGWAKKNLEGMNIDWASSLDTTLRKLVKGRFDLFVGVSPVALFNIKKLSYKDQITEIPNVIDSVSFNLCIGKNSPFVSILPKFDETMKQMSEDGKLEEIYKKYR